METEKEETQPCENFMPQEKGMLNDYIHQCPRCGGGRGFCTNCFTDHHENGWQSCTETLLKKS